MTNAVLKIHVTSDFKKSLEKLPKHIQRLAETKDRCFRLNPFDTRLKTHKLKGELKDFWAYSITHQYRILFRFIRQNEVIYYDIGTHEIYC